MFFLDHKLDWKKVLSWPLALNALSLRKTNHQRKKRGIPAVTDGWRTSHPPAFGLIEASSLGAPWLAGRRCCGKDDEGSSCDSIDFVKDKN